MKRLSFFISLVFLVVLLTACASQAAPQPAGVKALEDLTPTNLPRESPTASMRSEIVSSDPPASCPITRATDVPFVPPEPFPPQPPERYVNQFWYGTPDLWTMLGSGGTWWALPHNKSGYGQKVFWWSEHFDVSTNSYPPFTVIIEQLDADAPPSPIVVAEEATNASADFGTAMLTGVEIPALGCWKITGRYQDAELSFVVWVAP